MASFSTKSKQESGLEGLQGSALHSRYSELAALATTGTLSEKEWQELRAHLAECEVCSQEIQKYRRIALSDMPQLMADSIGSESAAQEIWTPQQAKQDLFTRLARGDEAGWSRDKEAPSQVLAWKVLPKKWKVALRYAAAAIFIITGVTSAHYFASRRSQQRAQKLLSAPLQTSAANTFQDELAKLTKEKSALDAQLSDRDNQIASLAASMDAAKMDLAKLHAAQAQNEQELRQQAGDLSKMQSENTAIVIERDGLAGKLEESEASFTSMKAAYDHLRQQRNADMVHTASLETRIDELSARLNNRDQVTDQDAQLLASDRDIRELMGARDLYIADVFDVDSNGRTQKSFGRIFYTRGKSLIFYAFDLDKQHGVHNASTFQAWGRVGRNDPHPTNMGIFYLDSEANRRWTLKFDNADVLARIDTVFVTVAPKGGSEAPRGQPLLVASLHSQPNHP